MHREKAWMASCGSIRKVVYSISWETRAEGFLPTTNPLTRETETRAVHGGIVENKYNCPLHMFSLYNSQSSP